MPIELAEVKRIAQDVAHAHDPALEVVGASTAEGGSAYTEVTVTIHGCRKEPCMIVIGADRSGEEAALRSEFASRLREHLEQHRRRPRSRAAFSPSAPPASGVKHSTRQTAGD
jgi:hypothetical protein